VADAADEFEIETIDEDAIGDQFAANDAPL